MRYLRAIGVIAALLAGAGAAAQTPAQWYQEQMAAMSQSDAIMDRANRQHDLLAQYQVMRRAYAADGQRAFRAIFGQYLSWYQTFIGDYADAERSFSIDQRAQRGDAPSPITKPGWHAVPALQAIPQLAKNYRVVFLNEAHNIALTRTLTVRLLKPLRAEGFNVFAVETLYHSGIKALDQRGYPTASSGFYMREPIYAEMVRTALRLGYKVVAYEADARHQTSDARETQQAANLWKILKNDPHAKLVVNAGYAHIQKTGEFLGGRSMAEHFMQDSGLDPLSIGQTVMIPHEDHALDYPYYDPIIKALHPQQPIIFLNGQGKPWSLRAGYNVSVIFPEEHFVDGRPTWLGLWGARVPVTITGDVCQRHWPCMVAARYANESQAAIPADRMVLDPVPLMTVDDIKITRGASSTPIGQLYLRPGYRYRLTVSDASGHVIGSTMLDVTRHAAGDAPVLRALPPASAAPCASAAATRPPPCHAGVSQP